jgi:hypothetical protein
VILGPIASTILLALDRALLTVAPPIGLSSSSFLEIGSAPGDLKLGLGGLQESLTVTLQAGVVETTRSEVAAVVTQRQIDSLPVCHEGERTADAMIIKKP